MKKITLRQITDACGGQYFGDKNLCDSVVSSIVTDSRKVKENSLFAAVCGQRVDGHDFIEKCFESGAVCALCEKAPESTDKPYILVESTLQALKAIAEFYRTLFTIPIIGVTGSVGKTSTKEMLYAVLSQKYNVHKTQGNFNNELGVPLTLFEMDEHHEIAVIEMGISDFGEMTRLSKMVKPDVSVITNIGTCHLENLIDRDGVLKAKTEMFKFLKDNGTVFLNGDDDKLRTVTEVNGKKPVFFGLENSNDYVAKDIENRGIDGIKCNLCFNSEKLCVTIPAMGNHMAANAVAAAAVGKHFGMDNESIIKGVASFKNVGSRSNVIKTDRITIIDDCYNANPVSMKASIDALSMVKTRRVAIVGDMKELGENENALHAQIGEYLCDKNIEFVIAVGNLAKNIAGNCEQSVWFEDLDEALESVLSFIKTGDTVLVKASHSMQFEKISQKLKEF